MKTLAAPTMHTPHNKESSPNTMTQWHELVAQIKVWGKELGFNAVGISHCQFEEEEAALLEWLTQGMHGEMAYMERHGSKRSRPASLVAGTLSIISVRINYLPKSARDPQEILQDPNKAYIARYALGKDYHRLIRKRLQKLAEYITTVVDDLVYRAFCDSAPVLEKPIGQQAGLGWSGKHTNLIDCKEGSWFFLGELYTNLPLPPSVPSEKNYCGSCHRCMDVCPTDAIISPWKIDARRCISYLTIELKGSIPLELRPLIGNRIYGCDDCQIFCPWNRHAQYSDEVAFNPRYAIDDIELTELFAWERYQFEQCFSGSPIRRIGYERWLRNISVAIGNAPYSKRNINTLLKRRCDRSPLVAEHVRWALRQQLNKRKKIGDRDAIEA